MQIFVPVLLPVRDDKVSGDSGKRERGYPTLMLRTISFSVLSWNFSTMACRTFSSRTSGSGSGGATDAVGTSEFCVPDISPVFSAVSSGCSEGMGFLGTETVAKPLATGFKAFFFFAMTGTARHECQAKGSQGIGSASDLSGVVGGERLGKGV